MPRADLGGGSVTADAWPSGPGTYILFFVPQTAIAVGKLGSLQLAPGYYAYVGSAHGPGGLNARLRRHLRRDKRTHWHIDYLTTVLPIRHVYAVESEQKLECAWVRYLLALPGARAPILGFGNGDCREGCPAHLLRLPDGYDPIRFVMSAGGPLPSCVKTS